MKVEIKLEDKGTRLILEIRKVTDYSKWRISTNEFRFDDIEPERYNRGTLPTIWAYEQVEDDIDHFDSRLYYDENTNEFIAKVETPTGEEIFREELPFSTFSFIDTP